VNSAGWFFRALVYRKIVPLTVAVIAVPSLLLFRACNDLFECWEVTRFYLAEGHLSWFTNRAEEIITALTS
jgi:hypothetical protein